VRDHVSLPRFNKRPIAGAIIIAQSFYKRLFELQRMQQQQQQQQRDGAARA